MDALKGQQYFSPGQARERAALGWYAAAPSGRRNGEPASTFCLYRGALWRPASEPERSL